mmetsp:Transcript_81845/g.265110  ORF Transcript_81845/g.265110 Transcript_81845/m.265110 type:complete len:264 (-) Transcript_81845:410-1201(-)
MPRSVTSAQGDLYAEAPCGALPCPCRRRGPMHEQQVERRSPGRSEGTSRQGGVDSSLGELQAASLHLAEQHRCLLPPSPRLARTRCSSEAHVVGRERAAGRLGEQSQGGAPLGGLLACTQRGIVADDVRANMDARMELPQQIQCALPSGAPLAGSDGCIVRHDVGPQGSLLHANEEVQRAPPLTALLTRADGRIVRDSPGNQIIAPNVVQQNQRSLPLRRLFERAEEGIVSDDVRAHTCLPSRIYLQCQRHLPAALPPTSTGR